MYITKLSRQGQGPSELPPAFPHSSSECKVTVVCHRLGRYEIASHISSGKVNVRDKITAALLNDPDRTQTDKSQTNTITGEA